MALVPYKKNGQLTTSRGRHVQASFNPNQLMYDLGFGAMEGAGNLAIRAVKGIVSAFQNRGASKQEIKSIVAPLAKSLTYTSRKPKFTKAEGGLSIEHIENVPIQVAGHTQFIVDSNLFVWLKGIANQFEEYQIQLWFAWNPICPATTTGKVMMAFDYDPDDDNAGGYVHASDYFNTADHCISAIWAPAAISPQRSGWLKTGNNADARFYSPGRFHVNVTDVEAGYLTVKYQVSLRKPQPSATNAEAIFGGTYNSSTNIFTNRSLVTGASMLIDSINDHEVWISATPGYKIVVWSTDATVSSVAPTFANALIAGVKTGGGAAFWGVVKPDTQAVISATVTAPGGATAYKLSVIQLDINPMYYNW
jgi:hypothetical protein